MAYEGMLAQQRLSQIVSAIVIWQCTRFFCIFKASKTSIYVEATTIRQRLAIGAAIR